MKAGTQGCKLTSKHYQLHPLFKSAGYNLIQASHLRTNNNNLQFRCKTWKIHLGSHSCNYREDQEGLRINASAEISRPDIGGDGSQELIPKDSVCSPLLIKPGGVHAKGSCALQAVP